MHFNFLCKTYACLNNKFTAYKQKKKKYFEFMSFSSNFPGNSQKIAKLFLNNTFNIVLLLEAILFSLNDAT